MSALAIFAREHDRFYRQEGFIWQSDLQRMGKIESWDLLCDERGKRTSLRGDCEDAALTIMERCLRSGMPRDRIGIARVATEVADSRAPFDHAVCVLLEGNEIVKVSDNRSLQAGLVNPAFLRGHRWYDLVTPDSLRERKAARALSRDVA